MSDPIIGIDLGTSTTVVARASASGTVQVLADANGYKIHPSVVSFHPTGGVVVGAAAKQRKIIDPKNTIFSVKRLIGRSFQSPEVQIARQRMPYEIKEGANQLPLVVTRAGEFAVPEISAIVLDHAKNVATAALGTEVSRAVVTVPASFNDAQRSATATAGSIAGLTVVRVLNEPTAAALAYGHTRSLRETIAVYDFGGGTFDVTILKLQDQVYEVLGTAGDSFLGGDDLDERLVDRMVEKFLQDHRVDLRSNEVSMMRLRAVAEQVKIELSRRSRAMVRIDEVAYGPNGKALDLVIEIRRDEFVQQVADIIDRTFPVCDEALKLAGLTIDHVDDVILVGGTTKIPYVRDQVARFFAKAPRTDVNPEDAVALGAALQASALERMLARKRPSTSRPVAAPAFDGSEGTFGGETTGADTFVEPTTPAPRRGTSESDAERASTSRPGEYVMKRGAPVDVFEERTPTPTTAPVIGRMTRQNARPPSRPPLPPTRTQPLPAVRPRTKPPTASPQARTIVIPPPVPSKATASPPPPPPPATTLRGVGAVLPEDDFSDVLPRQEAEQPASPVPVAESELPGSVPTLVAPQTYPVLASLATAAPESPAPPSPVVLDVTPRGLGIGTVAGYCEELIRRNSRVPTQIRKLFTTSRDDQEVVRIVVCQGESRKLVNNVVLGDLVLEGLPRRPRGETAIEVTFAIDASGILQVHARDAQTGRDARASLDIVGTIQKEDVAAAREKLQALRR